MSGLPSNGDVLVSPTTANANSSGGSGLIPAEPSEPGRHVQWTVSNSSNPQQAAASSALREPRSIQEGLAREVIRKLRLAAETETKEDRDIVCEEVFHDITYELDEPARQALQVAEPAPNPADPQSHLLEDPGVCFYQVLAAHLQRSSDTAQALLHLCQRLWDHAWVAPIYALLLHRWLLARREPGGVRAKAEQLQDPSVQHQARLQQEQQQQAGQPPVLTPAAAGVLLKHVNVLMHGARQLFLGDVAAGRQAFRPLWAFLRDLDCCCGTSPTGQQQQQQPQQQLQQQHALKVEPSTGAGADGADAGLVNLQPGEAIGAAAVAVVNAAAGDTGETSTGPQQQQQQEQGQQRQQQQAAADTAAAAAAGKAPRGVRFAEPEAPPQPTGSSAGDTGGGSDGSSVVPPAAQAGMLALVVAFLPYYTPDDQVVGLVARLPGPGGERGGVGPGSGLDFLVCEVTETLRNVRSEAALLKYLSALARLRHSGTTALSTATSTAAGSATTPAAAAAAAAAAGAGAEGGSQGGGGSSCRSSGGGSSNGGGGGGGLPLASLPLATRLRLASELYALTSAGGPHYAPRSVRQAAFATLDALYPSGRSTRWAVRVLSQTLHMEWLPLGLGRWFAPVHWGAWLYGKVLLAAFYCLYRLVVWRPAHDASITAARPDLGKGVQAAWRQRKDQHKDKQKDKHKA